MTRLTDFLNNRSKNKDKTRRIDRKEQKAQRMSPFKDISKENLKQYLQSLNSPLHVVGCYTALIGENNFFKDGSEFLKYSNFYDFADRISISKGITSPIIHTENSKKEETLEYSLKKSTIRWHMPGDDSFLAPHAGGPGYDSPFHAFIDVYLILERVQNN